MPVFTSHSPVFYDRASDQLKYWEQGTPEQGPVEQAITTAGAGIANGGGSVVATAAGAVTITPAAGQSASVLGPFTVGAGPTLYVDPDTGEIGVGTSAPSRTFDVRGTVQFVGTFDANATPQYVGGLARVYIGDDLWTTGALVVGSAAAFRHNGTTLSANEAAGQNVISLASVAGYAISDYVEIVLNSGEHFRTTITNISGNDVTIATALPSAANSGNAFYEVMPFDPRGSITLGRDLAAQNHTLMKFFRRGPKARIGLTSLDEVMIQATESDTPTGIKIGADYLVVGNVTRVAGAELTLLGDFVQVESGGTVRNTISMSGSFATVFNETGADIDFRIESDTNPNAFVVDAGLNRVGIMNAAPGTELDVTGIITTSGGVVANGVVVLSNAIGSLASTADQVRLGAYDLSAGNATLSLSTETAVGGSPAAANASLAIRINGASYALHLTAL